MCDMRLSAIDHSEIFVFSDFKKAFDLVDDKIQQQKLKIILQLNNSYVVPFLQSYLLDRSQSACANGELSAVGTIQ